MTTDKAAIEAMARAMCRYNWPGGSERDINEMWRGWEGEATAALAALREMEGRDG